MGVSRWDVISVDVEKNVADTRNESWKIVGSRENWDYLEDSVRKVGRVKNSDQRREIVTDNLTSCVSELNNNHISLGFIKPQIIHKMYFGKNDQYGKPIQLPLLESYAKEWPKVKYDYELEPRLKYSCEQCQTKQGFHDQVILEWGFYEGMRKNPDNLEQVWENAQFLSDEHEIFLFVGNQQNRRNSYVIISVIRLKKQEKPTTKSMF
ncbi:MAG: hypothetical protein CL607_01435 [Anaerolineaceae bacterium]|nr:hypothetical protein [Anaerolineaceae bacterium]